MKKLVRNGIVFIVCLLISSVSFSQSEKGNYLKFDYIKVQPENVHKYIQYMQETWMPLYQQQIKNGSIDSWSLYRVFTPGGARGSYNFVAITSASGLEAFESLQPRDILQMTKKDQQTISNMMSQANSLRTVMFTELWKAINKIDSDEPSPHSARFLMFDYMDVAPGKDYDYQMLEDEIAKPLHQARREKDQMQAWEVFTLISPSGNNYGYNFATGNYFDELENIEFGFTEDLIKSAMPGTDIPEMFDTIFSTRTLVNSEVWELIERTE